MTTRFDITFEKDVIFDDFDKNKFYAGNWSLVFDQQGNNVFKAGKGNIYELAEKDPKINNLIYKKEVILITKMDSRFLVFTNSKYSDKFFII